LFEDRPHIRGRRIPVEIIVSQQRLNRWSIAETAYNFSLSESEVLAALLYYAENQSLMDAQIAQSIAEHESMKQLHGKQNQVVSGRDDAQGSSGTA
jgi:uncharacterized protein (DUF433 family)